MQAQITTKSFKNYIEQQKRRNTPRFRSRAFALAKATVSETLYAVTTCAYFNPMFSNCVLVGCNKILTLRPVSNVWTFETVHDKNDNLF